MSHGIHRTSLTRHAASMRDPDPDGAHKLAARMWREHGHIAIRPESLARLPWQDREILERICDNLYGPREG